MHPVFIAALFTTDEWIKKIWCVCIYIYILEYYAAIKKNEMLPWINSVQSLSCVRLCDPMKCSTPGLPVHHQLPEFICSNTDESESEVAQSCPTLCDSMDCSPPGSSIHGILQARVLEWVAISFSRGSSRPRDQTQVSCVAGRRFNL